jgi:acyl carrier protein
METSARIREVLAEVLDLDPALIDGTFSRDGAPEWDSLAHLRLVTALEEAFGIKLTMKEVGEMDRYTKIRDRIEAHLHR